MIKLLKSATSVFLVIILCGCSTLIHDDDQKSEGTNQVSQFSTDKYLIKEINQILNENDFNGSIYIKYKGRMLLNETQGFKNAQGDSVDTKTMYLMGSSQKFVTGLIVKKLEDKNLIDRNQFVSYYLPQFKGMKITVKNLLMHRSGLRPYHITHEYKGIDGTVATIANNGMNPAFAKVYRYNDANYIILAKIIEVVTKKTYKQNVYQYIIDPLQLKNTGFYDDKVKQPYFAEAYNTSLLFNSSIKPYGLDQYEGAGNMYISAPDLAKLSSAFYHNRIFNSEETKLMRTNIDGNKQPYRYGFNVKDGYLRLRGYFFSQEVMCWFNNKLTIAIVSNKVDKEKVKKNEIRLRAIYTLLDRASNEEK